MSMVVSGGPEFASVIHLRFASLLRQYVCKYKQQRAPEVAGGRPAATDATLRGGRDLAVLTWGCAATGTVQKQ